MAPFRLLFICIFIIFTHTLYSQEWVQLDTIDIPNFDHNSRFIQTQNEDLIVVKVYFKKNTLYNPTVPYSDKTFTISISKRTPSLTSKWEKSYTDTGYRELNDIIEYKSNLYFCGAFSDTLKLDTFTLVSNGRTDAFLAKMDSSGNIVWARSYGSKRDDALHHITNDLAGNIWVSGIFTDSLIIGAQQFSRNGQTISFWSKFSSNGNPIQTKSGYATEYGPYILCNTDAVYITGNYYSPITLENITLATKGVQNQFMLKYNSAGDSVRWLKNIIYGDNFAAWTIKKTINNKIIITASYSQSIIFNGSIRTSSPPGIQTSNLLSLIDSSGATVWLKEFKNINDKGSVGISSVVTDSSGFLYIAGDFKGVCTFDTFNVNSNAFISSVLVSKLKPNGDMEWIRTTDNDIHNDVQGIFLKSNGDIIIEVVGGNDKKNQYGCLSHPINHLTQSNSFTIARISQNHPIINLGMDTTLCKGRTLTLNAYIPNAKYLWQDSSTQPIFTVSKQGKYFVSLLSDKGCAADTITISLDSIPVINLGSDQTLCASKTLTLTSNKKIKNHIWQDGSTDSTFTVVAPGLYTLTQSNSCGQSIDSITIKYLDPPTITLGMDTTLCSGDLLNITLPNQEASYIWNTGVSDRNITLSQKGLFWCKASNMCGTDMDSISIDVISPPVINLGGDRNLCDQSTFEFNLNNEQTHYIWNNLSTSSYAAISSKGKYWVTGTNQCGITSDTIEVYQKGCNCKAFIPTAFSPNDDGLNDMFNVILSCEVKSFHLTIYNRLSEKVFETESINNGWSGIDNEENIAPATAYFYTLSYTFKNGYSESNSGTFTLLR